MNKDIDNKEVMGTEEQGDIEIGRVILDEHGTMYLTCPLLEKINPTPSFQRDTQEAINLIQKAYYELILGEELHMVKDKVEHKESDVEANDLDE